MEKEIEDYVDDLYFSILIDQEELLPISDDRYAEELQLQECIMSSVLLMASHISIHAPSVTTPTKARTVVVTQSSSSGSSIAQSSTSFCEICMEWKPWAEMFASNNCSHVFCTDCIGRHITAKIQDNPTLITCPGLNCRGVLEPHICQSIVPNEVFERWGKLLCESAMIGNGRIIYCPYKDCLTPLMDDDGELVMEAECPCCRRLFCVQCEVPWHSGVGCSVFQSMDVNESVRVDLTLMELSKKMKWTRCPSCKFFVERTEGCPHMTCRF